MLEVKDKKLALNRSELLTNWLQAWNLGRKSQNVTVNLGALFCQLSQNGSSEFNCHYLEYLMQHYGSTEISEVYSPLNS